MKRKQTLLVATGVLVLLCGAAALVLNTEEKIDRVKTHGSEILAVDPETVTALAWTLDGNSLSFVKAEDTWRDESDSAFPVDQAAFEKLLREFESVSASFVVDEPADLGQYGLAQPQSTVTLTAGETVWTLELGDYSQMDERRYLSLDGQTVYLIDTDLLDALPQDRDELMEQDSLPSYDTLESIVLTGAETLTVEHHEEEGLSYSDDYTYFLMEEETALPLATTKVKSLVSTLRTLGYADYATYTASEVDLVNYGLDTPERTITLTYTTDGETRSSSLAFGSKGGKYYYRLDQSEIIYTLSEESYDKVMEMGYETLRPTEVEALDWSGVTAIDFTLGEDQGSILCTKKKATLDETEVEVEDLQAAVDALQYTDYLTVQPEKKREVELVFHLDSEDFPTLTVALYRYDGEHCLAQVDGQTEGLVERSQVVDLMEALNGILLSLDEETE